MVLAQKQTHRLMEENKEHGNEHTLVRSINLDKEARYTMGKRWPL